MKLGMLLVAAMLCATMVGTSNLYAGDLGNPIQALKNMSPARIEKAKKSYLEALDAANDGVVESAIGIVLQWHMINPKEDLSRCERKINDLALNGGTPAIRFKASLASLVIDHPSLVNFDAASCDDCGALFDALTKSVRQMVIGHMIR